MDTQKFKIEIDGIEREANVVNIMNIDSKQILVYSIQGVDDTSELYYSEVIKDELGYDKLIDVENEEIKSKVIELINSMLV